MTLKLHATIYAMATFFPSYRPSVRTDSTTRAENCPSQPPPRRVVSKRVEAPPSVTSCVLYEAASLVLLDGRHRLQALCDIQKAKDVAQIRASLLVRCVTRNKGCSIAEQEALRLSNLSKKVTDIKSRNFPFFAKVKAVTNFSAAFENMHHVSLLTDRTVDIVKDVVLSDSLSGNSSQAYQCCIRVIKVFVNTNIFSILLRTLTGGDWF